MLSDNASAQLLGALSRLLSAVNAVDLGLDVPHAKKTRELRAEVADQLSDYVIPRLVQLDAPLLTVVGGSTGAGKSTLVNSIVGETVTESGVLRPTTRSPVLVHHPDEGEWFRPDRILPDLPRTEAVTNDVYALRLVASRFVPRGLAVLDAPDIDSIDADNRQLAAQLLAAADLWLFVTSAARYADQVPWEYLRRAADRSTSVAVVLDRTHDDHVVEVRGHLARMMTSRGLSDSPLFTVPESEVDAHGLLPREAVAPVVGWLHDLAADPAGRAAVVHATLDGAVRHNVMRSYDIADALESHVGAARQLHGDLEASWDKATRAVAEQTSDGTLMRGELVARWQEFVGSGELLRSVEDRVSRLRDRFVDNVTGRRTRSTDVLEAAAAGIQSLVLEHAETAAGQTSRAWQATPAGAALLGAHPGLERASRDVRVSAERLVRDWQQRVFDLVRAAGQDKRLTAKFLALGVNGVGVAVMVLVFVRNAGTDDVGGSAAAQTLLDAVLGRSVVEDLVRRAAEDLETGVVVPLAAEQRRFTDLLSPAASLEAAQIELREAARQSEYARHADFLDDGGKHR